MLTLLQNDIIQETLRLAGKNSLLSVRIKDYSMYSDHRSNVRLLQWYQFLNEHYTHQPCIHNQLLHVIVDDFCTQQSLLAQQTIEELEISLSLLEKIFHSPHFIELNNDAVARYLITVLFIYGKYPGMVVGSTYKAVNRLAGVADMHKARQMFETLFVPFENPKGVTDLLHLLTLTEIESLMYILQGTSKKNKALPVTLSKKEYNYFMRELESVDLYKDDILFRHCIYAKLLCRPVNNTLFTHFISNCRMLRFDARKFAQKIPFWIDVLQLINQTNAEDDFHIIDYYLNNLLDYLEFMAYNTNDYSVAGRTLNSLTVQMHDWHREIDMEFASRKSSYRWSMKGENCRLIRHEGFTYIFLKITTGARLVYESKIMKHCVYTYVNDCMEGKSAIWSVIRKTRTRHKPLITVEINALGQLIQAFGKHNIPISSSEQRLLSKWCKLENFHIHSNVFNEEDLNMDTHSIEHHYLSHQLNALQRMMPV